jgi:Trpc4-associated protein
MLGGMLGGLAAVASRNTNGNGNANGNEVGAGGGVAGDVRMLYNMDQELEALMDGTAQTLKALALSTYQVELLFVLYALLAGKRKAEIQDRLASLGLITTATALFDKTDWLKPPTPLAPHERAPHGPQCECNPDAALKIQLLRLILNFCDGDFENRHNKLLLLSLEELHALYAATPGSQLPTTTHFERSAVSGPGLLSKLISVFYKLPQDQNNRFWMASCIEAFLRGSEPIFQKFVAKSGMLSYLIEDIVSDSPKVQGSMQTSFDLLGELMKFNREIFAEFNEIVTASGPNLTKFFNNVVMHLVDSNVFLRGMVLSMERFKEQDRNQEISGNSDLAPYPFAKCVISQFLERHGFRLVKDLMTVVSIDAINQENICCVNTTMVFCIYAHRKGQLRPFVASIREEEKAYEQNLGQAALPSSISSNFQKLLWFWHEYYLLRGKDCMSLEFTSQIPFSEWMATYDVLVEELGEFDPSALYEQWRERKAAV